jgi:hypothetical protein
MSERARCRRGLRGFPVLGLCGVFLLAAGAVAIATDAFACTNCNCYYSSDCATGQSCNYSSGCRVWSANGKTVDGTCTSSAGASAIAPSERFVAAQALDLWLRAWEAAAHHGGTPNALLINEARALPLTKEQQDTVRQTAFNTMVELFGLTTSSDAYGAVTLPSDVICISPSDPAPIGEGNGTMHQLTAEQIAVANIVREAMTAEMLEPGTGELARIMERIPQEYPDYVVRGICHLPSASSGQKFPYKNTADCMTQEIQRVVHSILLNG